jgi:hypothetical protein
MLGQWGLRVELPPRDLRTHQESGVTLTDGDVLPTTQTAIPLGGCIVAFGIREGILLPGQQSAPVADGTEQYRSLLEPG